MAEVCHECGVELPTGSTFSFGGTYLCRWHYLEVVGEDPAAELGAASSSPAEIESAVRDRHLFEDRLTQFLALAAAMTDRELEIALARLADRISASNDALSGDTRFKGEVLHCYYSLRQSNAKKQNRLARVKAGLGFGSTSERLQQQVAEFRLLPHRPDAQEVGEELDERIRYLAP